MNKKVARLDWQSMYSEIMMWTPAYYSNYIYHDSPCLLLHCTQFEWVTLETTLALVIFGVLEVHIGLLQEGPEGRLHMPLRRCPLLDGKHDLWCILLTVEYASHHTDGGVGTQAIMINFSRWETWWWWWGKRVIIFLLQLL